MNWIMFLIKRWKEVLLALLIIILFFEIKARHRAEDELNTTKGTLTLKDDELAKFVIENNRLKATGTDPNSSRAGYVPPESPVTATLKENKDLKQNLDKLDSKIRSLMAASGNNAEELARLKKERDDLASKVYQLNFQYHTFGLTFRLGLGAICSPVQTNGMPNIKLLPEFDGKFMYWNRFSGEIGVNPQFFDLGISRHVDDFTPDILNLTNTEIKFCVGKEYDLKEWRVAFGLRVNL